MLREDGSATGVGLRNDVPDEYGGYRDEAEPVDLRYPVAVGCDTSKIHHIPSLSGPRLVGRLLCGGS